MKIDEELNIKHYVGVYDEEQDVEVDHFLLGLINSRNVNRFAWTLKVCWLGSAVLHLAEPQQQ